VKLGIFMLIVGLLIAGFGIFLWSMITECVNSLAPGTMISGEAFYYKAGGAGLVVFGSGLTIGGIVRMIVKR